MTHIPLRLVTWLPTLIGPLAYLAPNGLTILLSLTALLAVWAAWPLARADLRRLAAAGLPLWPLLLVGVASVAWSIIPGFSAHKAGQMWPLALLGLVLILAIAGGRLPLDHRRLLTVTAAGFAVTAVFVLADMALTGALSGWFRPVAEGWLAAAYSRGAATHAVFALPLTLGLWATGARRLAGLTLVLALTPFALDQMSAKLALIIATAIAITVFALPALRWAVLAVQLAAVLAPPLLLPLPYTEGLCGLIDTKASIVHRVSIWNFAHARWAERPVAGWGWGATRAVPGGRDYADFLTPCGREVKTLPGGRLDLPQQLPLHTHNSILQVWLELGALGAAALAWLIFALNRHAFVAAPSRLGHAAAAATSAGIFTVAIISFGAWQSWWWSAALLAIALTGAARTVASQSSGGSPSAGAR